MYVNIYAPIRFQVKTQLRDGNFFYSCENQKPAQPIHEGASVKLMWTKELKKNIAIHLPVHLYTGNASLSLSFMPLPHDNITLLTYDNVIPIGEREKIFFAMVTAETKQIG